MTKGIAIALKKFFSIIKLNIKMFLSTSFKIVATVFTIFSVVICFISWDDIGNPSVCCRIVVFVSTIVFLLIISIIKVQPKYCF